MSHDRDIAGMIQARHARTQERKQAALNAIQRLKDNGVPIDFQTVANEADCSRSFLYNTVELRDLINAERQRAKMPTAEATDELQANHDDAKEPSLGPGALRMAFKRNKSHLERLTRVMKTLIEHLDPETRPTGTKATRRLNPAEIEDKIKEAAALMRYADIRLSVWRLHAMTGFPIEMILDVIKPPSLLARELMTDLAMHKQDDQS